MQLEETLDKEKDMTEWLKSIPVRIIKNLDIGDSIPKTFSSGNQSFKPSKPANLVRPQGIKPPPPGRTK
jgi:hypothetical protein